MDSFFLKIFMVLSLAIAVSACESNDFSSGTGLSGAKTGSGSVAKEPNQSDFKTISIGDNCSKQGIGRDVVFVLDSTTSVSNTNWDHFLEIVRSAVARMNVGLGHTQTRYAVFEFANAKGLGLDQAVASKQIYFLAGNHQTLASNASAMQSVSSANRNLREGSYDGVGPALVRAQEYLNRVGRAHTSKEIWAIHDMSCCGFPANGDTGTQIDDAAFVRAQGTTIVGIRTLRSSATSDSLATPGLAFDLGMDIGNVGTTVLNDIAIRVGSSICAP